MVADIREEDIAVIGFSGRFPGACDVDSFWHSLLEGKECLSELSDTELREAGVSETLLANNNYVKVAGPIDNLEGFDYRFFGLSLKEARLLDPQHRQFLMAVWETFEHAGYIPEQIKTRVGVFASCGMSQYLLKNILKNNEVVSNADEYQLLLGNDKDFLATRISYLFNFRGPSLSIQTGCSSSLTCLHYACQSLLNGECELAIAGGVSITLPQNQGYLYKKEMIGSPDGHCRPFDDSARGTIKTNGLGVVLLKPLKEAVEDGDKVHAVIIGSAINNDGMHKVSYTAPNLSQQAAVIKEALHVAEIDPNKVGYVETHGTGTILGDPIEVAALKKVFTASERKAHCVLGSLKSNFGHMDVAAGIAGFIKACCVVRDGKIPAMINFNQLNTRIKFEGTPFFINTDLQEWNSENQPRVAGVSAFGVGGTNVHVVVKQPPFSNTKTDFHSNVEVIYKFSAKSSTALKGGIEKVRNYMLLNPDIPESDIAYSLEHHRLAMPYRKAFYGKSRADILEQLSKFSLENNLSEKKKQPVVFLFPGQGMQYVGMAKHLYENHVIFRQYFERCANIFSRELDYDLKAVIYPSVDNLTSTMLNDTLYTQPALFCIEYALARYFIHLGLVPDALLGHSIGEYVAAAIAEVLTLEDIIKLISVRCSLMQKLPKGSMLVVFADEATVRSLMFDTIDIALENAPKITVVAGGTEEIKRFKTFLKDQKIASHILNTSHAFHSRMMTPIINSFKEVLETFNFHPPKYRIVSNCHGDFIDEDQLQSSDYWVDHLLNTVKFSSCVYAVERKLSPVYIECGPGNALTVLLKSHGIKSVYQVLASSSDTQSDQEKITHCLISLWEHGYPISFGTQGRYVPLPHYCWDLERCWVEPANVEMVKQHEKTVMNHEQQTLSEDYLADLWEKCLGQRPTVENNNFFNLGGSSLLAIQLIDSLPETIKQKVNVVDLYSYPHFENFFNFINSLTPVASTAISVMDENDLFESQGEL